MSHDFLIPVLIDLALFFRSDNLWASILRLTSENVLVFMYRWMRSSRIFFIISLSAWFILLFNLKTFASTPVSSSTALVMRWPSILLEDFSACFLNICSAIQKISKTSAVILHRPPLFLVFTSLCSGNSCFSSPNLPAAKVSKYSWSISGLFSLFFWRVLVCEKMSKKHVLLNKTQLIFLCRWDLQNYI